jgi:nicotinate-nucleotide adenylyltransferase
LVQLALDEVVFVPAGEPRLKERDDVTDADIRVLMTRLAIESNHSFSISEVDVLRPGPTYTVDTLRDIQGEYPGAELYFIVGADAALTIHAWHQADQLAELANFVAVTRPGTPFSETALRAQPVELIRIEAPGVAISSTECRARVPLGLPLRYLVPDAVADLIATFGLYMDLQH